MVTDHDKPGEGEITLGLQSHATGYAILGGLVSGLISYREEMSIFSLKRCTVLII